MLRAGSLYNTGKAAAPGTQFLTQVTCFSSTKVPILTPTELQASQAAAQAHEQSAREATQALAPLRRHLAAVEREVQALNGHQKAFEDAREEERERALGDQARLKHHLIIINGVFHDVKEHIVV